MGNAKYSSHRIQNELITLCRRVLNEANTANAFSIIANETVDISGVQQLTIIVI